MADIDDDIEDETDEPSYCNQCSGTGEGMHDGSRCSSCRGTGIEQDHEAREEYEMERAERAEQAYQDRLLCDD